MGHTNVMIPRAEHAAFVGNPEEFHKEILRFLSTQCTLGEDTDTMDSDLNDMYDDDELFGYQRDDDVDSDYYDKDVDTGSDGLNNQNMEEYLAQYFAGDDGYDSDYYDDTDLYFDNKDLTDEEGEGEEVGYDEAIEKYDEIGEADTEDPDLGDDD